MNRKAIKKVLAFGYFLREFKINLIVLMLENFIMEQRALDFIS